MEKLERRILSALTEKPKTIWQLYLELDVPERAMVRAMNSLNSKGLINTEGKIALKGSFETKPTPKLKCDSCEGRTLLPKGWFAEVLKRFEDATKGVEPAEDEFQQSRMPPIGSISKAMFLHSRGDLEKSDVLLVGDDDFMSIALALTGLPKRIEVLEISDSLIREIKDIAKENGLDIGVRKYDVRDALPKDLEAGFDAFVTDPPGTEEAQKAFVSRAAQALRGAGCAGLVSHSWQDSNPAKWRRVERNLLEMNFAITDVVRQFSSYLEPEDEWTEVYPQLPLIKNLDFKVGKPDLDWWRASLFRVELVDKPNPLVMGKITPGKEFYVDEDAWDVIPDTWDSTQ